MGMASDRCHDVIASERFPHSPASQLALFPVELVATGRAHGPTGTWVCSGTGTAIPSVPCLWDLGHRDMCALISRQRGINWVYRYILCFTDDKTKRRDCFVLFTVKNLTRKSWHLLHITDLDLPIFYHGTQRRP